MPAPTLPTTKVAIQKELTQLWQRLNIVTDQLAYLDQAIRPYGFTTIAPHNVKFVLKCLATHITNLIQILNPHQEQPHDPTQP